MRAELDVKIKLIQLLIDQSFKMLVVWNVYAPKYTFGTFTFHWKYISGIVATVVIYDWSSPLLIFFKIKTTFDYFMSKYFSHV